jgi:hypothetical protein
MRYNSTGTLQAYLNGTFIQKSSSPANQVAAGNTIVLAFNDNTNGRYEFWDSKSGTSMTGTKAATNFATGIALKLGTTQNPSRYFNGMVGEVRIFNWVLDATTLSGLGHKCGNVSLAQGNCQAQGTPATALKTPESHPKAAHKPTTSVLLALYYGILILRYRCHALAPGLQCAWRALQGGLVPARGCLNRSGRGWIVALGGDNAPAGGVGGEYGSARRAGEVR